MTTTCAQCSAIRETKPAKDGTARVPMGWHRVGDALLCADCMARRYVMRAITIPVVGPEDATWADLRVALTAAWGETTRAANWIATELYARDVRRAPGDAKLPKMPRVYLYPEVRAAFPGLASQTVTSLIRDVEAKYRARRYDLIWRSAVSLPTYRYPHPLPLPSQMWSLAEQNGRWSLSARIGDRRWYLRLRGGAEMRRQVAALRALADGSCVGGAAALYQVTAHAGDHRNGIGTAQTRTRLMLKIAAWMPRGEGHGAGTLTVRTGSNYLLSAQCDGSGGATWRLAGDDIRRVIIQDARRRERLAVDMKAERRSPRRRREGIASHLARVAERQRNRLSTWCHQAAAMLVGHAQRRRCAMLVYDDADRSALPSFPWDQLRQRLAEKCAAAGITYALASGDVARAEPRPLASTGEASES